MDDSTSGRECCCASEGGSEVDGGQTGAAATSAVEEGGRAAMARPTLRRFDLISRSLPCRERQGGRGATRAEFGG